MMKYHPLFITVFLILISSCAPSVPNEKSKGVVETRNRESSQDTVKNELAPPQKATSNIQSECQKKGSEVELKECLAKNYDQADKALNEIYQEVKSKMAKGESDSLITAQLDWISYRDKTCESETYANRGGTSYRGFLNACLARVTIARELELRNLLTMIAGSEPVKSNHQKSNPAKSVTSKASIDQLASKAMLTPAQAESLLQSERADTVAEMRTIVPTYIPEGYKIETVEADWCGKFQRDNNIKKTNTFKIVYRKSLKQSFSIRNVLLCGQGGADPTMSERLDIPSAKFERVWLNYTDFDSMVNGPRIVGEITTAPDSQGSSRGLLTMEYSSPQLNIEEARKIMESMEYLGGDR